MADAPVTSAATDTASGQIMGWLEVLDRTGKVARRFCVSSIPLILGRAYDCDIVLDDPYVCPHHVRIAWHEGMLRVADLGSVNGVWFGSAEVRRAEELLANDGRFRIGRTLLRFRRHDCPLPATWVDRPIHAPLRLVERPWMLVALYLGVLAYQGLDFYLTSSGRMEPVGVVTEMVALVAVVVAWAALWSFPGRLLMGRWNYFIHCGIAAFGIVAFGVSEVLSGILCYMLDADRLLPVLTEGSAWLVFGGVLYAHLTYLVAVPAARLMRWAGSVTAVLAALVVLVQYFEAQEFRSSPDYTVTLKPPLFRVREGVARDQVVTMLDELRLGVDAGQSLKDEEKR